MAKRNSFSEVARAAGVSVATISRVANGSAHVSPELRTRIIKTAAKLHVDLSQRCRPMANIIAFLLCNREVLHLFHSRVLAGAEAYCALHDYGLLFLSFRYSANVPWKDLYLPEIIFAARYRPCRDCGRYELSKSLYPVGARRNTFGSFGK